MDIHIIKKAVLSSIILGTSLNVLASDLPKEFVDDKGNITLPADFRISTTHLGSWYVPSGGASGFHGVYTNEGTIEQFRKTGKFPDGAVLIKELRASNTGNYTTGQGVSHETVTLKQWFIMVKDSKSRFSENPLWADGWADGWGWALFKADAPTKNVASNYKIDCLGCYVPAKIKIGFIPKATLS